MPVSDAFNVLEYTRGLFPGRIRRWMARGEVGQLKGPRSVQSLTREGYFRHGHVLDQADRSVRRYKKRSGAP